MESLNGLYADDARTGSGRNVRFPGTDEELLRASDFHSYGGPFDFTAATMQPRLDDTLSPSTAVGTDDVMAGLGAGTQGSVLSTTPGGSRTPVLWKVLALDAEPSAPYLNTWPRVAPSEYTRAALKRERRKQQNRTAQHKHRKRKEKALQDLQAQNMELMSVNENLHASIETHRYEIAFLKTLLYETSLKATIPSSPEIENLDKLS